MPACQHHRTEAYGGAGGVQERGALIAALSRADATIGQIRKITFIASRASESRGQRSRMAAFLWRVLGGRPARQRATETGNKTAHDQPRAQPGRAFIA